MKKINCIMCRKKYKVKNNIKKRVCSKSCREKLTIIIKKETERYNRIKKELAKTINNMGG